MAVSDKTRKSLWARSGNRCAICRSELIGQLNKSTLSSNIGEECHIVSSKQNGPRYSLNYIGNHDQYSNLILLCSNHHKTIDELVKQYSVKKLKKIKSSHEQWIKLSIDCAVRTNKEDAELYSEAVSPIRSKHQLEEKAFEKEIQLLDKLSMQRNFALCLKKADKLASAYADKRDYLKAAELYKFMGTTYRHQGIFVRSKTKYAQSEAFIGKYLEVVGEDLNSKVLQWRLQASKTMLEQYFFLANCRNAILQYEELNDEITRYMKRNINDLASFQKLSTYQIHIIRQVGEMYRIMGNYEQAESNFEKAFNSYNINQKTERNYSLLGKADSLRMMGDFKSAGSLYSAILIQAKEDNDGRLEMRVLRNQLELYRTIADYEQYNNCLEVFETNLDKKKGVYQYGEIYLALIKGGRAILEDLDEALTIFSSLVESVFSNKYELLLEYAHCLFGLGEVHRFKGLKQAIHYYAEAKAIYEKRGIAYGIIRTTKAIEWAERSKNEKPFLNRKCLTESSLLSFKSRNYNGLLYINLL